MDLLILKNGNEYIRVVDGDYQTCGMDKASVFPLNQLSLVQDHMNQARKNGFSNLLIRKLVITEEPFVDGER